MSQPAGQQWPFSLICDHVESHITTEPSSLDRVSKKVKRAARRLYRLDKGRTAPSVVNFGNDKENALAFPSPTKVEEDQLAEMLQTACTVAAPSAASASRASRRARCRRDVVSAASAGGGKLARYNPSGNMDEQQATTTTRSRLAQRRNAVVTFLAPAALVVRPEASSASSSTSSSSSDEDDEDGGCTAFSTTPFHVRTSRSRALLALAQQQQQQQQDPLGILLSDTEGEGQPGRRTQPAPLLQPTLDLQAMQVAAAPAHQPKFMMTVMAGGGGHDGSGLLYNASAAPPPSRQVSPQRRQQHGHPLLPQPFAHQAQQHHRHHASRSGLGSTADVDGGFPSEFAVRRELQAKDEGTTFRRVAHVKELEDEE